MVNPYLIEPPFVIHFSGGRTSGYLLWKILQAYGYKLPEDSHVVFTNTGKEREETLGFVHEVETRWPVRVRWVEWTDKRLDRVGFREVDYGTASRNGEPFQALLDSKGFLPNVLSRLCTQHLKILACDRFLVSQWGRPDYTGVLGIRYDEPRRWKVRGQDRLNPHRWVEMPLVDAKVGQVEVLKWWSTCGFDLKLRPDESNCDLCFLKGNAKRVRIMAEHPEMAEWWIKQETGLTTKGNVKLFRSLDRKSYSQLYQIAMGQTPNAVPEPEDEQDLIECNCTD